MNWSDENHTSKAGPGWVRLILCALALVLNPQVGVAHHQIPEQKPTGVAAVVDTSLQATSCEKLDRDGLSAQMGGEVSTEEWEAYQARYHSECHNRDWRPAPKLPPSPQLAWAPDICSPPPGLVRAQGRSRTLLIAPDELTNGRFSRIFIPQQLSSVPVGDHRFYDYESVQETLRLMPNVVAGWPGQADMDPLPYVLSVDQGDEPMISLDFLDDQELAVVLFDGPSGPRAGSAGQTPIVPVVYTTFGCPSEQLLEANLGALKPVSEVPLPTTGLYLLWALAGLTLLGRRRA